MKISVFIPIFNEQQVLERDIELIVYVLNKLPAEYEIFVVDDASTDNSTIIGEKISKSDKRINHLRYEIGPTRRENLAQSFQKATGEIIVFMDIDLATNLANVPNLIEEVTKGYDIVTGSRYLPESRTKRRLFRLIISKLYNVFIRCYFKTRIKDHECGFKAFKSDVILTLVAEMGYDKTLRRGVFWDTELLVRALRNGYRIKEIPITWSDPGTSALSFRREVRTLPYIFKFKRRLKKERGLKIVLQ